MANYLLTYFGGQPPKTPEEGQAHFAQYQAWLAKLGDQVVSAMNPIKSAHTLKPDGQVVEGSATGLSGYTVIQAQSIEEALELTKDCPFLAIQGTLEIAELIEKG